MWIPATNTESFHQRYLGVVRQLEIQWWEDERADVKELVQEYPSRNDTG
jgi:hypothetical protein